MKARLILRNLCSSKIDANLIPDSSSSGGGVCGAKINIGSAHILSCADTTYCITMLAAAARSNGMRVAVQV